MAMDIDSDVGFLDPDTLQLHELSPSIRKSNPHIVDELFSQWLSLPDTSRLVRSLVADAESGVSLNLVGKSTATNSASSHSLPSIFPGGIGSSRTPPLSPRSIAKQRVANDISSKGSPLKLINEPVREAIPQFYFGSDPPPSNDMKENFLSKVNPFFSLHLDVVKVNEFKSVTKEICKLPSYLSTALFRKIDVNCNGHVSREQFIHYWMTSNMLTMDLATRVYNILKEPVHNYLVQDDFKPALQELLASHSGLQFLQTTPEFQERYAETVIYRIFYYVNRSGNGRLTLRELKRGNLIAAMQQVDEEEDINKVLKYFSYEHFYVIYCKFWELDNDHDFFIDKESLVKYSDHALTYRIVDRIFSQIPRKFTSIVEGKMSYEDFVYFILAEEDKTSEPSLEYWFKCIDLDGNGALTSNEMQFFFEEQLHRMECIGQVPMLFEDILCQIFDMVGPKNGGCITLQDIKGSKLGGTVFNILFNLNKFTSIESRETYLIHQEHGGPILTEWDRFARREYIRLSVEEDVEDDFNGSEDVWEESLEAPF